jgi:hypothetical protein
VFLRKKVTVTQRWSRVNYYSAAKEKYCSPVTFATEFIHFCYSCLVSGPGRFLLFQTELFVLSYPYELHPVQETGESEVGGEEISLLTPPCSGAYWCHSLLQAWGCKGSSPLPAPGNSVNSAHTFVTGPIISYAV